MNFWVHHCFQQEFGWSMTHYHFGGLNSSGFGHIWKGKAETESQSFLTIAHMGQPGHQYFSLAEVQPCQAPTEDLCPGDAAWTKQAYHVNTSRETCQVKIISRDFAKETLCSNCFVVIIKAGKGMSLVLSSQLGTLLTKQKNLRSRWPLLIKA